MDYKVSAKKTDGKWFNFGRIKTNSYGNLQLSFKNTAEFKDHVMKAGEWLNFSLFEDKPKEPAPRDPETQATLDKMYAETNISDSEIPF